MMKPETVSIPIQNLVSGDALTIKSFTFRGDRAGPFVYLQGNLHGPEIFGTAILTSLIERLFLTTDLTGTIRIVPLANPIGVQVQQYGYICGRWNSQNGKDWNRIFKKSLSDSVQLPSIEDIIAKTLQTLANDADVIIDLHTSGAQAVPHIYTRSEMVQHFHALEPRLVITLSDDDFSGAFDECCYFMAKEKNREVHVATWECGNHHKIEPIELKDRLELLLSYLATLGMIDYSHSSECTLQPYIVPQAETEKLYAETGGYLMWLKNSTDFVDEGEQYAVLFLPQEGRSIPLRAPYPFRLITLYGLQAVSQGQGIANIHKMPQKTAT